MSENQIAGRGLETIDWPSPGLSECPFPYYERLRQEAPVFKYPGRNQYLLSRWEDIVYVVEHLEIFIQGGARDDRRPTDALPNPDNEPLTPEQMARTNPPEHRLKRSRGLAFVSKERLRNYEALIVSLTDELLDAVIERSRMEFYREFANKLPVRLVADVLGLPREDTDMFVRWYENAAPLLRCSCLRRTAVSRRDCGRRRWRICGTQWRIGTRILGMTS